MDLINTDPFDYEAIRPRAVLMIEANGKRFYASFEDNPSAEALIEKLNSEKPVVEMHDCGGFEKVGALPFELPRSDRRITTEPGDIILHEGDRITICYDENTYSITRLARIGNVTRDELLSAFGEGSVTVEFSLEWSE